VLNAVLGRPGSPLRILCLGAHSDDIEIGCGGTLLRLLDERPGSSVHWVVFSSNAERELEARVSASAFLQRAGGSTIDVHAFRESFLPMVATDVKERFEALKPVAPEVVFTHRLEDRHQDHRTIAELTWNTFRDHLIIEYEIPKYEGDLGLPNLFVPLSADTAKRKVDLLMRHFPSQLSRSWFTPETFLALMRLRGIECNASEGVAEAFTARKLRL
jgi:LmbE family N-acetylglucosaminyl deacetylase